MNTRRSFLSALCALPFIGALARTASGYTDKRYWVRKVVSERPPIVGMPGETYLRAGIDAKACVASCRAYLDGEDISDFCFEVDTAGGWVGCFAHHYEGGKLVIDGGDKWHREGNAVTYCGVGRYWQFGEVEIRSK